MKEYIERAAVLKSLGYEETRRGDVLPGSTFDLILKEPSADVVEVRHAKWEEFDPGDGSRKWRCSDCRREILWYDPIRYRYCPSCGARMDKEDEP